MADKISQGIVVPTPTPRYLGIEGEHRTDGSGSGAWVTVSESTEACKTGVVISIALARRLRDAGLEWLPAQGDRFMVPDRDLDEHIFAISQMTVEAHRLTEGMRISFNGAVEWALDSIMQPEVIWLPSEAQLRNRLGRAFTSLRRSDGAFRCEVTVDGESRTYEADDPADAYALALLDLLAEPEAMLRLIVDDPS